MMARDFLLVMLQKTNVSTVALFVNVPRIHVCPVAVFAAEDNSTTNRAILERRRTVATALLVYLLSVVEMEKKNQENKPVTVVTTTQTQQILLLLAILPVSTAFKRLATVNPVDRALEPVGQLLNPLLR
jgi:hypothetical protein